MLEYLILGIILIHPYTGYDIKKCIGQRFGIFYKASFGSLYPALNRLEKKGYVTTYEEPQGGRKKIFYQITETGKDCVMEWLTSPMESLDGCNSNLIKIYFFDQLPDEERQQQLKQYERNNIEYLKKLQAIEKEFSTNEHMQHSYYKLSTLYYGIVITKQTIEWCRHIRQQKPLSDLTKERRCLK